VTVRRTRHIPWAALAGAVLLAACAADRDPGPEPVDQVRVLSWNIRYGTADDGPNSWPLRAHRIAGAIVDPGGVGASPADPPFDIVGVQEALRFQIDELLAAVPVYAYAGVGRDDGANAGEHCGVLYRTDRLELADAGAFWLSDTPDVPGSTSWGNDITRLCTWARFIPVGADTGFYVYSTHFDHRSEPSRREAVELIAFRIDAREHPAEPVILLGDFNAAPDSVERLYLTGDAEDATGDGIAPASPRLTDVLTYDPAAPRGTFNGWRYHPTRTGPDIDSILVSGMTVDDAEVARALGVGDDGRPPSDHYPIVATLRFD